MISDGEHRSIHCFQFMDYVLMQSYNPSLNWRIQYEKKKRNGAKEMENSLRGDVLEVNSR